MFPDFLICPVCGASLVREGGSLYCRGDGKRHCYDVASSGYVNLLPPGKGGNRHTGDDAAMIAARSRFLSGGYYDAIPAAAAELAVAGLSASEDPVRVCDAGSGEGYHTLRMAAELGRLTGREVIALGVDASKRGAAAGAKRAGGAPDGISVSFAAGNIFSLPVADRSLDVLFSLFAPIPSEKAARVLKEDGLLVVVASAPRHLWELRSILYDEPRESTLPAPPSGWKQIARREVRERVFLPDRETILDLFAMTPFFWRTPREGVARLQQTDSLTVSVEADLFLYRRES